MQLTSITATPPPPAAAASPSLASRLGPLVNALRSDDAPPAQEAPAAPPVDTAQPASAGAALLGRVGSKQNQYLLNQQLLGAISVGLSDRIGQIASTAWAMLRGTQPTPPAATTQAPPAA